VWTRFCRYVFIYTYTHTYIFYVWVCVCMCVCVWAVKRCLWKLESPQKMATVALAPTLKKVTLLNCQSKHVTVNLHCVSGWVWVRERERDRERLRGKCCLGSSEHNGNCAPCLWLISSPSLYTLLIRTVAPFRHIPTAMATQIFTIIEMHR